MLFVYGIGAMPKVLEVCMGNQHVDQPPPPPATEEHGLHGRWFVDTKLPKMLGLLLYCFGNAMITLRLDGHV